MLLYPLYKEGLVRHPIFILYYNIIIIIYSIRVIISFVIIHLIILKYKNYFNDIIELYSILGYV